MNVTRQQTKAFLEVMLGGDQPYEDSSLILHSPQVVAFLAGALPKHGAPDWYYMFEHASRPLAHTFAAGQLEEFTQFLEGVVRCLRNPDEGK